MKRALKISSPFFAVGCGMMLYACFKWSAGWEILGIIVNLFGLAYFCGFCDGRVSVYREKSKS